MGRAIDLFVTYRFLKLLTTPFKKTDAFKLGIIDAKGHRILKPKTDKPAVEIATTETRNAYTILHKLVFNLKKLFNKVPGLRTKVGTYAAALFLLKDTFKELTLADWGDVSNFDMIINATSVGLNTNEKIDLDLSKIGENKFFYDVIYNPSETNFLKMGKNLGNRAENGKFMFIYQAHQSFTIWHKLMPNINEETIKLLD